MTDGGRHTLPKKRKGGEKKKVSGEPAHHACEMSPLEVFFKIPCRVSAAVYAVFSSPPAGIGIGMLCVSTLVCLYYNVIIAWSFYYLGSSFQSPLPWSCDAVVNAGLCGNSTAGNGSRRILSPSEIFWKYVCVHLSQSVSRPSLYSVGMTPALLLAASACWVW